MELSQRLEQILSQLRGAFSRQASFQWFVILVWGILLNTQAPAITSYLNALGLAESYYHQALHWFHSSAFSIDKLMKQWGNWLKEHRQVHRLKGQRVYVSDGIKVGKEGRKMPGVKKLHQESEDVSKPEWIRGHYFSALALLIGVGEALFATPLSFKLHDGIEKKPEEQKTLVEAMATLCIEYMEQGSYTILDAYFACGKVLKLFREHSLHLISRVRITTVAHAPFCACPGQRRRGRPRLWGSEVKLREVFAPLKECEQAEVRLYGQKITVYYQIIQLYWDSPDKPVLFVLTQFASGHQVILLSSDVTLSGPEVIEAYGWRFKIEVSFRTLIHLLDGFCYRFWLKPMPRASKWPGNLRLVDYEPTFQQQVLRKVEAFERFVNLHAIVLGILQVIAVEMPAQVWKHFPGWFRTVPGHGYPSEQIVRLSLRHQCQGNLIGSRPTLLLDKFMAEKMGLPDPSDELPFAA